MVVNIIMKKETETIFFDDPNKQSPKKNVKYDTRIRNKLNKRKQLTYV